MNYNLEFLILFYTIIKLIIIKALFLNNSIKFYVYKPIFLVYFKNLRWVIREFGLGYRILNFCIQLLFYIGNFNYGFCTIIIVILIIHFISLN